MNQTSKALHQELERLLLEQGASLIGCADLSALPQEATQGFSFGISIGVALNKNVVQGIPTGPHPDYDREYTQVNAQLDHLADLAESWLVEQGHSAYAVTVKRAPYQKEECRTPLPHKTVARLAGLGWIGKNTLLVTRDYGSAVRFTSVLTSLALPASQKSDPAGHCGGCKRCQEACPGGAISGIPWEEGTDRDTMLNTAACSEVFRIRGLASGQKNGNCGLCMAACPYTARHLAEK